MASTLKEILNVPQNFQAPTHVPQRTKTKPNTLFLLSLFPSLSLSTPLSMFPKQSEDEDDQKLQEWIQKVKSGGNMPYMDPPNCSKGWTTPHGESFMVRGSDYLSSKKKIHGGDYLLHPLGFDWIRSDSKISKILSHEHGRVRKSLEELGFHPFIWAFNLQLPYKNYSLIFYFVSREPIEEGSLMDRFIKGDEGFRNSRLKMIANVVEGPWIVKAAVGEQAVSILGRAAVCRYVDGENYLEVDVDTGVSIVATAIIRLAFGYVKSLTVDIAFLIEGQDESELPEKILGAVRFSELDPDVAGVLENPGGKDGRTLQSQNPSRVWSFH